MFHRLVIILPLCIWQFYLDERKKISNYLTILTDILKVWYMLIALTLTILDKQVVNIPLP